MINVELNPEIQLFNLFEFAFAEELDLIEEGAAREKCNRMKQWLQNEIEKQEATERTERSDAEGLAEGAKK